MDHTLVRFPVSIVVPLRDLDSHLAHVRPLPIPVDHPDRRNPMVAQQAVRLLVVESPPAPTRQPQWTDSLPLCLRRLDNHQGAATHRQQE
jgi:hypothetical protein